MADTPNKVISWKNLPARLPIFPTITMYLLLVQLQAAEWVWGAIGLFTVLIWIISIIAVCRQVKIDIFEVKS